MHIALEHLDNGQCISNSTSARLVSLCSNRMDINISTQAVKHEIGPLNLTSFPSMLIVKEEKLSVVSGTADNVKHTPQKLKSTNAPSHILIQHVYASLVCVQIDARGGEREW